VINKINHWTAVIMT